MVFIHMENAEYLWYLYSWKMLYTLLFTHVVNAISMLFTSVVNAIHLVIYTCGKCNTPSYLHLW